MDYLFNKFNVFQSTLPVWGATLTTSRRNTRLPYFNPRSPCGERHAQAYTDKLIHQHFNPRSPCGERRLHHPTTPVSNSFQSTLPVWGATIWRQPMLNELSKISIHAPRVGSDILILCIIPHRIISIHAPRVGSDGTSCKRCAGNADFNPRSPCGERHHLLSCLPPVFYISIHAPRVGSDICVAGCCPRSTISIHAPRVGSDPRQV